MPIDMPAKTDPDSLGFLLNDTSRLMRRGLERRIADIGLQITAGEARALIYVAANEGARQSVIADCMGVEPMTVCGYIDRLEKCGLVRRQPDPTDRRAKNVRTTEAAEATIAAIRAEARSVVEQAQTALDAPARLMLTAVLKQLRGNLLDMLGERDQPGPGGACPPQD
jgi:MarR family transcriptional regulator, transcriptional regulator for hemolysin